MHKATSKIDLALCNSTTDIIIRFSEEADAGMLAACCIYSVVAREHIFLSSATGLTKKQTRCFIRSVLNSRGEHLAARVSWAGPRKDGT